MQLTAVEETKNVELIVSDILRHVSKIEGPAAARLSVLYLFDVLQFFDHSVDFSIAHVELDDGQTEKYDQGQAAQVLTSNQTQPKLGSIDERLFE